MSLTPLGIRAAEGGGQLVSSSVFIGILWSSTCISLSFLLFRIFVRINVFHKLYIDDYLVIGAWILILISAIIWQTQEAVLYEFYNLLYTGTLPDALFVSHFGVFLKLQNALLVLFYTSLWTIKLSFLLFFRRLGSKASGFTVWWWVVLGLSIATWLTCIGDIPWNCSRGGEKQIFGVCSSQAHVTYEWITLHYNCAVDVITDALIITIPVLLLWNVKMAMRQKLALLGIFSLITITMIFAVVRVAVVFTDQGSPSMLWLGLWQSIQMAISVIIASLGSFRQLFIAQSNSRQTPHRGHLQLHPSHTQESGNLSFWRRGFLRLSSRKSDFSLQPTTSTSDSRIEEKKNKLGNGRNLGNTCTSDGCTMSLPLHSVRITDEYDVEFGPGSG